MTTLPQLSDNNAAQYHISPCLANPPQAYAGYRTSRGIIALRSPDGNRRDRLPASDRRIIRQTSPRQNCAHVARFTGSWLDGK
jgi:hypothetical protein